MDAVVETASDLPGHDLVDLAIPDVPYSDLAIPDAPTRDHAFPDLALPDLAAPDVPQPDLGCLEPPSVKTNMPCNQQCVSPSTSDNDCDGLGPKNADPQATCNPILFVDDFQSAPTAAVWTSNIPHPWFCDKLKLETTTKATSARITLANASLLGSGGQRYLVEAKFKLAKVNHDQSQEWRVGIRTGLDTKELNCELWVSKKNGQLSPGLHMNRYTSCGGLSGAWSGTAPGATQGANLILQSYNDGSTSVCRILDSAGNVLETRSNYHCPSTTPDRFFVYALNATVIVDSVRVFQVN